MIQLRVTPISFGNVQDNAGDTIVNLAVKAIR
jgi:hypothetical protein